MEFNPFAAGKLLRFPERISQWLKNGTTSGPIVVDFDLTNRCPHDCPRCPGEWRRDPSAEMSKLDALSWLGQFRELGALAVSFGGGGDPLAHPDAVDIISEAHRMGYCVGVITNGAILKPGWAERLTGACKWIRVSLDAATPETFARVHGVPKAHFETILDNIRKLAWVPTRQAVIGVGFLTDEATAPEIPSAALLVKMLGADYIQYRPYNFDTYDPTHEIRRAAAETNEARFRVLASWPKYEEMRDGYVKPYKLCRVHHFCAVVTAHGNMHLCCDFKTPTGYVGSLKTHSAKEIWSSGARERVAAAIDLSRCPPLCRGNVHNILLEQIAEPMDHEEFL